MKKIGLLMSILMGVTLSFFLSLINLLISGHFTVVGFIVNFLVSFSASMAIGSMVPIHKVSEAACKKAGFTPDNKGKVFFEALISDIIYTPLMTVVMVTMAYKDATANGAKLSYVPMLLKSLALNLVIGYVLVLVFMPLFMKMLIKKFIPGKEGTPPEQTEQRPE